MWIMNIRFFGCTKTFLISTLPARIQSKNGIALLVKSSGIAKLLWDGGRIAHAPLEQPLNIQNKPDAVYYKQKTNVHGNIAEASVKLTFGMNTL